MLDHVKDRVLLIIDDTLRESLALHRECSRGLLPDDMEGLPCAYPDRHATGIDVEIKCEIPEGSNPGGPKEPDLPGRTPDGGRRQLGRGEGEDALCGPLGGIGIGPSRGVERGEIMHERGMERVNGAGIMFVDEGTGEEGNGVEDCVFETGRRHAEVD